jgi:predicted DsbA family dithiol-disulfide isomerase
LEQLFAGRDINVATSQARMKGLMEQENLPYGDRTHTYNSRLAQELGKWADTKGQGEAFHDAMFRAYFVEAQNIADIDTLVTIAASVELPASEAREVLTERRFQDAVDADWQRSRDSGITGVPTFVMDGRGVVGAQPYEVIERLLTMSGATPRNG